MPDQEDLDELQDQEEAQAAERGPAAAAAAAKVDVDVAGEDLLIDRQDLGPGCATLVAAGDPIPPALADLPRQPRIPRGRRRRPGPTELKHDG